MSYFDPYDFNHDGTVDGMELYCEMGDFCRTYSDPRERLRNYRALGVNPGDFGDWNLERQVQEMEDLDE